MRTQVQVSEAELRQSIFKDSFYEFLLYFWDTVIAEEFIDNWHIRILCYELQRVVDNYENDGDKYDLLINVPPGTTKSTICSIMFPIWIWARNPSFRTICGSYTFPLAMDLSRKSRSIVLSEKFKAVYPYRLIEDQNAKFYFVNNKKGARTSTSTLASIVGFHGHFLIVDDPIDPLSATRISKKELDAVNEWVFETLAMRKVEKTKTPMIMIMQRLSQGDPSEEMIERSKKKKTPLRHICLPGEIRTNPKTVRPVRLKRFYRDGLLDPIRLPWHTLDDIRNESDMLYAGQILQTPSQREGGMFKVERIEILESPPVSVDLVQIVRFWDKAGTTGEKSKFTVGTKLAKSKDGVYWILDSVRGKWHSGEREKVIKQTAIMDGKKVIVGIEVEPGSGGLESAENTAKNLAGFRVRLERPTGSKLERADPFSVQVNIGNVKMVKGEWNAAMIDELRHCGPNAIYMDQVDTLSGGFKILTKPKVAKAL